MASPIDQASFLAAQTTAAVIITPEPAVDESSNSTEPQAGQNHDRDAATVVDPPPPASPPLFIAPPPPPSLLGVPSAPQTQVPTSGVRFSGDDNDADQQNSTDEESQSESGDGSATGSDHDDSEDDDNVHRRNRWQPIKEDTSLPCDDEMVYIQTKKEHSALDTTYWATEVLFDPDDPEITTIETSHIDWIVDHFNGTKANPNKEVIMHSPVSRVGGYDWRIKFYPKGNHSDYLSVYLENTTMQDPKFDEFEDFTALPLPFLESQTPIKKRRSCAVQLSVVMYNPEEPRTYEYQTDAHQFTKQVADYGWTRFTRSGRRDFHLREHGQRQAILRGDRLGFRAYIRVVNDPTGCLWNHGSNPYEDSVFMTGLRPWTPLLPQYSGFIPLLHFAPFREFLYGCSNATSIVAWLQMFLWKMMSRTHSKDYGSTTGHGIQADAIMWLQRAARCLKEEIDADIINDMIGSFEEHQGAAIGGNRLKTKDKGSIQAALNAHPTPLSTPMLLTLELQRQEYDSEKRRWKRLTNKVEMPNHISVPGKFYPTRYTLFAFTTHVGGLTSNQFHFYVRPQGPTGQWYAYTDRHVTCLTHKQAVEKHCGIDPGAPADKPKAATRYSWKSLHGHLNTVQDGDEIAQVVMYVRDDVSQVTFANTRLEKWDVHHGTIHADTDNANNNIVMPNLADFEQTEVRAALRAPSTTSASPKFTIADGHASPEVWLRDTEGDVVMSDADDDSTSEDQAVAQDLSPDAVLHVKHDGFGRDFYEGDQLRRQFHGHGHWIRMNGDEYTGEFVNGQPHGTGTMTYASTGDVYAGSWALGAHDGHGTLTERATGNIFSGGWKAGRKHGSFVLRGDITEDDKACCSICYDREINTAFYDCGHVVACKFCANMVDTCPVCRRKVLGRVELFGVKLRKD